MARFDDCLAFTLKSEGGFSDNPADPGGATNFGVTLSTLQAYLKRPCTVNDVRNITPETVKGVYQMYYWDRMNCDNLPHGIDLMVFDFGVNTGCVRSVKILQDVVGSSVDGQMGPYTLHATQASPLIGTILHLAESQAAYYKSLSTFSTFGKGWLNRTQLRKEAALAAAGV